MITGAVFGLALVVSASVDANIQSPLAPNPSGLQMSSQQKNAAMRPLVRSATDCIIHAVAADPHLQISAKSGDINELIVASMTLCPFRRCRARERYCCVVAKFRWPIQSWSW